MKRRYRNPPPPNDAEYVVGEGFELKPEQDRVNTGKPLPPSVELIPVGPAPLVLELKPEQDRAAQPATPTKRSRDSIPNFTTTRSSDSSPDLTAIAAAAFGMPVKPSRRKRPAPKPHERTEERDALIAQLMGPLWGMAWRLARPDHDLAEELRAHVLLKCELGCYDPRMGAFLAWVRTTMTRHLVTMLQSRGRATGADAATEQADSRLPTVHEDARTAPFTPEDLARIRKWGPVKRVLLLSRSLLWGKLPAEMWAETLATIGLPATFPGPVFEDMSVAQRNEYLADALGVSRKTIHTRMGRWEQYLFELQFVRDLAAGK